MPRFLLRQGDARDLLADLDDQSVHLVVTDPPYFIDRMGQDWDDKGLRQSAAKAGVVGGLPVGMKFDARQGHAFQAFMSGIATECLRLLKPGGFFLCFSQPRLYPRLGVAVEDAGFELRDTITWQRPGQAKAFSQDHFVRRRIAAGKLTQAQGAEILERLDGRKTPQLRSDSELITVAQKPREGTFIDNWLTHETGLIDMSRHWNGKTPANVISSSRIRAGKSADNPHFTVKPVDVLTHLIEVFSRPGQWVLDPFMGSGSHGVAALMAGRNAIGIERVDSYAALARERMRAAGGVPLDADTVDPLTTPDPESGAA